MLLQATLHEPHFSTIPKLTRCPRIFLVLDQHRMKNESFYGRAYWQYFWSNNAAIQHVQMLCLYMWASGLLSEFYLESAMFWQPTSTSVPSSIALSTSKASIHRQADNSINHYSQEILALLGKKLKGLEPFIRNLFQGFNSLKNHYCCN